MTTLMSEIWSMSSGLRSQYPNAVVALSPLEYRSALDGNQDWILWFNRGYLTEVFPQLYFSSISSFKTSLANTFSAVGAASIARMGVGIRIVYVFIYILFFVFKYILF